MFIHSMLLLNLSPIGMDHIASGHFHLSDPFYFIYYNEKVAKKFPSVRPPFLIVLQSSIMVMSHVHERCLNIKKNFRTQFIHL